MFDLQSRQRRIVADGSNPAFSHDGRSIAYFTASGEFDALWIAPTQGGPSRRIARGVSTETVAWSPDGRQLAFTGYTKRSLLPYLFVIDIKTGHLHRVAGSVQLTTPAWSPNGNRIAFAT